MRAWHYTPRRNWLKIREEGLIPLLIDHPDIVGLGLGPVFGTWVWLEPQEGRAHLGNLIFQLSSKGLPCVVKLEVDWQPDDAWTNQHGDGLRLRHEGTLGPPVRGRTEMTTRRGVPFWYHTSEPSLILGCRIPPERIHLVGSYDMVAALA
jgi:hypothetical protein